MTRSASLPSKRIKQTDPGRVRVELRASWEPAETSGARVTSQPAETPGLAFFDRTNGHWEQADFRLKGTFSTNAAGHPVEVKQDPARMRPSDIPTNVCNHVRFTQRTGWKPQVPLEETLRDVLEYWRKRET